MEQRQRQVLWTTCLSHGMIHVFELSVPPLLLLIQAEFGAGDFQMGRVVTWYGMLFGLGALPAGFLVDRLGSKALLLLCLWGASLSVLGMAISPTLTGFAVCAAVMGLCLSIYHPAGTALITHSVPISGRVFALHGMAGNFGVAGASLLAGGLGALLGWRGALVALALVGAGLGLRVLALPAPTPHEIRSRPGRGRWTGFALLLVAAAFMGMVYRGMTTFLPKFYALSFAEDASVGTAVGGALTTASLLIGLAGMYTAGRIADRGVPPSLVFLIGAVAQLPGLLLIVRASGSVLVPIFMGVAFFHFFTQPAGNHMVADFTPPRWRGLGYGVYFFLAFGAGASGAAIGGWVSEQRGLAHAFEAFGALLIPAIAAASLLGLWVLRQSRRAPATG